MSPAQFLDLVEGRTARFDLFPDGVHVGIEEFLSRDRSVWTRADGSCAYGRITTDTRQICFEYEDQPGLLHCWVPFVRDDRVFVIDTDGSEIQEITELSDVPVDCIDLPLS